MEEIIQKLAKGEQLPEKNKDHPLSGDYIGYRECHINYQAQKEIEVIDQMMNSESISHEYKVLLLPYIKGGIKKFWVDEFRLPTNTIELVYDKY